MLNNTADFMRATPEQRLEMYDNVIQHIREHPELTTYQSTSSGLASTTSISHHPPTSISHHPRKHSAITHHPTTSSLTRCSQIWTTISRTDWPTCSRELASPFDTIPRFTDSRYQDQPVAGGN